MTTFPQYSQLCSQFYVCQYWATTTNSTMKLLYVTTKKGRPAFVCIVSSLLYISDTLKCDSYLLLNFAVKLKHIEALALVYSLR